MAGSPWSNQVVSLIILTEQATGFSGLFGYSPTVGAGNLIFSVDAANTTDESGNTVYQGIASYLGNLVAQMNAGGVGFQVAAGQITGGYEAVVSAGAAAGQLVITSGGNSALDPQAEIALASGAVAGTPTVTVSDNLTVNGNLTVVNLTVNTGASISGGLTVDTINGSSSTGAGDNGGVTSGPSGTVNSFPAAGPNHTHSEFHHHPI